jgi:hypothetical protein
MQMVFMLRFLFVVVFMQLNLMAISQTVNNVRVSTFQRTIEVVYDLKAESFTTVELYFSEDSGTTWKGPMKNVSGDVGGNQLEGNGKKIIWDASTELGSIEGFLQFKVVAKYGQTKLISLNDSILNNRLMQVEKQKKDSKLFLLRKKRNIWIIPSAITAGVGGYAYYQTELLYQKYKTATTDASKLRMQVQRMALVYPIAFAAAGFSVLEFMIQNRKYSKEKNMQVVFSPITSSGGSGFTLAVNF